MPGEHFLHAEEGALEILKDCVETFCASELHEKVANISPVAKEGIPDNSEKEIHRFHAKAFA